MAITRNRSARLGRTNIMTATVMAACISLSAHAQEQIEPADSQLKMPAQEVERLQQESEALKQDKEDADDPTKAISPSSTKEQPSGLKDSDKLPAVQQDKLPAVQQDRLPAVQKDKLPAVQKQQPVSGEPEFVRVAPESGAPGSQIRIEGRHFGPDRGDRGLYFIIEGRGYDMAIRGWHDNQIMAVVPRHVDPGSAEIRMVSRDADTILTAIDFEVVSAIADRDVLPDDAGRPDTGGPTSGGFAPSTVDMAPELHFYRRPTVRSLSTGYTAAAGLAYGTEHEIMFGVQNRSTTKSATFKPAYDFVDAGNMNSFPAQTLGPGESTEVRMQFNLESLGEGIKKKALEGSLTLRIFLARSEADGDGFSGWYYHDAHVSNHIESMDYDVLRNLKLVVQLERLRQYGLCKGWAQSRDWLFYIYLTDGDYITRRIDKPPFREGRVRASHRLSPTIEYEYEIDSTGGNITTTPMLFALKNNGRVKNSGRSAGFTISESLDGLINRAVSGRAWKTTSVRSTNRGGSFCDSNLELEARLRIAVAPYAR